MPATPTDRTIPDVPSCALDQAGLREQRGRYASLAASVTRVERNEEALYVEFAEDFDRDTLERALAVERQCCPFFQFELEERRRRLRATVRQPEHLPALEAIAQALGVAKAA